MAKEIKKKPFVIALPKELSKNVGHVENYDKIPKTGTIMATTPLGAVSEYLHREGISSSYSNLILDRLNKMGGKNKAGRYAFNFSDLETRNEKGREIRTTYHDRQIAEEAVVAYFLSRRYGGKDTSYRSKAQELLKNSRNLR